MKRRRRYWWEPYRRTFRSRHTSGAWFEMDVELCPINRRLACAALRAGGLPPTRDLPGIFEIIRDDVERKAENWRGKMIARWDET